MKLCGEEHEATLRDAFNYASTLGRLERYAEAKSLLRNTMPVGRRVLGAAHEFTIKMSWIYAKALYANPAATLDELREAVTTLEETEGTARRVFGAAHPTVMDIQHGLQTARELLAAREALREAKAAEAITPGERVTDKE